MNEKQKKFLYYGLLAVLILVFCVSGFYVIRYYSDAAAQKDRYDELASIMENARPATEPGQTQTTVPGETAAPTEAPILKEYQDLYAMNSDMVGWLRIEDTKINYPVMQTPQEPDFYLYRNFDKAYNAHGCLYADSDCDVDTPSDNVTIYGHHMMDGSMLAGLDDYSQKEFWESHPNIQFDSLTAHRTYEIFAVFKTSASVGKGLEYHQFINAMTQEDFDWFVSQCKELAFYDTGITPEYGDKLVCLSTCEYSQTNGRLVVAAVMRAE